MILLVLGSSLTMFGSACASAVSRTVPGEVSATRISSAPSDPILQVPGVPNRPDMVTVVPFQLWRGPKDAWIGQEMALLFFHAEMEGIDGTYMFDTGNPQQWFNRDSLPPNPAFAKLKGEEQALTVIHTERIGTLTVHLDSTVGEPLKMYTNAQVGVNYDPANNKLVTGHIGLNGIEPFEVIVDFVHQRLIWIRLDSTGRRMVVVPAYTPAGMVPLVPCDIHGSPLNPAEWWGIEGRRGGVLDTLLIDSGTQGETDISLADQHRAADQLKQALGASPFLPRIALVGERRETSMYWAFLFSID